MGGGENHIRNLSRELVKLGCSVTLISRSLQTDDCPSPPREELHHDGLFKIHRLGPDSPFRNLLGRGTYIPLSVLKALRIDDVDIIHAQSFSAGVPVLALRRLTGKPAVITVHGTYLGMWGSLVPSWQAELLEVIERLVLFRNYDRIITVDKHFRNLASKLGYPTDRITYIPNGVELERFSPGVNRGRSANFLFVGRLVAQKGLEYLVRASALLKKKGLDFSVDIVGDGPLNDDIRKLVHELGVEDCVRFLGYVSDDALPRIYSEADIFVLPSVWEGLPLTILEAWASELPVIATNVGGIGDVSVHAENALVVPSGDVEAFAEAMEQLISDTSLRKKLGKNGRELVESGYTWKRVAERTMEVYEQLLSRE